jgi:hypothetical protein
MPNHVTTVITIDDMPDTALRPLLFDRVTNKFDFGILVPIPSHVWQGNVTFGKDGPFKLNALDWCSQNWGTKWNAYGARSLNKTVDGNGSIVEFDTAWGTPYPWMTALFKAIKKPFSYTSDNEGVDGTAHGKFFFDRDNSPDWSEELLQELTP